MFTFKCTRCQKKPAIVTRGRKVFLCADCATGSLWYDMVGALVDDEEGSSPPPAEPVPDQTQAQDEVPVEEVDPFNPSYRAS